MIIIKLKRSILMTKFAGYCVKNDIIGVVAEGYRNCYEALLQQKHCSVYPHGFILVNISSGSDVYAAQSKILIYVLQVCRIFLPLWDSLFCYSIVVMGKIWYFVDLISNLNTLKFVIFHSWNVTETDVINKFLHKCAQRMCR